MSYSKDGYPIEFANKVGHIKLIQDPMIQRMIESFEDYRPLPKHTYPNVSGAVDLDVPSPITQIITIDGGHQAVQNTLRAERQVGFIQVVSQMVKLETIDYLRNHPMVDPREVHKLLSQYTHYTLAALPISGIHIPGMSVKGSIREAIHRYISHYELYYALAYLVYRQWEVQPLETASMDCLDCYNRFELSRNAIAFNCPKCSYSYWLSDYLGLCNFDIEDRSTEETVSNFRTILEALVLMSFVIRFLEYEEIMSRTLFLLDGPLLLRAQLSRLVEPIRSLIDYQRKRGRSIYLIGVEKTGEFREFTNNYATKIETSGGFFIPSVQYIIEEIKGRYFDPSEYRNRVSYGAKSIARIGKDHTLAMNIPTGKFKLTPTYEELIGLPEILRTLSKVISYEYENGLIPIVLANSAASISNQPSGGILAQFVEKLLKNKS
jgi:hypothetical protein